MEETPGRWRVPPATYYYRRELGVRELLPAIGIAVAAGAAAFYLARLLLQRAPLAPLDGARPTSSHAVPHSVAATGRPRA
jgi:hypothetical protein